MTAQPEHRAETEADARPVGEGYAYVRYEPTPYDFGLTDDPELERAEMETAPGSEPRPEATFADFIESMAAHGPGRPIPETAADIARATEADAEAEIR